MRNPNPTRPAATRMLAAVLTWTFVLGQLTPTAYAALTPLGDVPIAAKVAAKPNIVYTVDDSGSMLSNFIPDFVTQATSSYPAFCRLYPSVSAVGKPFYATNGGNNVSLGACGAGGASFMSPFNYPPFYTGGFNHLAYNPGVTYTPPLKANGLPLTYNIGTITDGNGNQIDMTKVQTDPYNSPASTVVLIPALTPLAAVRVPLYCNSDWPIISNPPVIGEVGDAAGEYIGSAGGHCRINGTKYDPQANGATAIIDDYNYPWPKVGVAAGAVGTANTAAYFWRQVATRQIWCDKTNAAWPQTCNGAWTCTKGGVYTPPASQPQTCYLQSIGSTCTLFGSVYTELGKPAGSGQPSPTANGFASCNLDPAYDLGGCVTTPETACLVCIKTTPCLVTTPQSNGACHLTANGGPPGSGGTGTACNCVGAGCTLPACGPYTPTPTNANCSKGVVTQKCSLNAGACNDILFDPAIPGNVVAGTTLLQDSNLVNGGTGAVCRHNNFDYGAGAFPGTYPTGLFITPISSGCPANIPTDIAIPRHYYVADSVDFCTTPNSIANDKWNGFGASTCQSKNDFATHKYVKYGQFHRTDLVAGRAYPYVDAVTGVAGVRTWAEESINYANWYAYYRTRILAAKTTSAIAFSFLDKTYRVGFHDLGTSSPTAVKWVDVDDFEDNPLSPISPTHRSDWYNALFGINVTNFSTYTMNALLRVGNLFKTGGAGGLPATVNPLPASAKDPITLSCQSNFHILITDGFTNQPTLPVVVGEQDALEPATFPPTIPTENMLPNLIANVGKPWPTPFVQQTKAVPDTLSDIATYYWANDLRPALKNDVPAWPSKSSDLGLPTANDLNYTLDVAWWQHVSFSAISFGSEGILDASNNNSTPTGTVPLIKSGALSWPDLTNPNSPTFPVADKGAAGVDDLWHATVNSRGTFVYAKSPIEVEYGLAGILNGITNNEKARAGVAFNGQVLDQNNNVIFEPKIEPGWAGDLLKIEIDPITLAEVKTWWAASTTLANQIDPVLTGQTEPWMMDKYRRVVTLTAASGPGVPFIDTKLTAAQLLSLSPDPVKQKAMISYLRGGSTFNGGARIIEGTKPGQFRKRSGPLGDLSNAQPLIITPPKRGYKDATDPGYSAYVAAQAARPTVVVAPANDGMVHVFDAGPMPSAGPPAVAVAAGGGTELFAFIPRSLFRGVAGSVLTEDVTALQALTYQDAGAPIYHHHMYVDASPRAADIDFSNGGGNWHTIVVGGLGKGGNGFYALDLTDVAVPDEATAVTKVLWEWNNPDSDVAFGAAMNTGISPGYSYGRPVIVKVRDKLYPFGRWVVIVTGGYNNLSGKGQVYFLDAKTGTLLSTITTSAGTGANPSGLAQLHGFVKDQTNQTVEQIYGGDLLGNVWRIDVSAVDSYKTAPAELFAQLTDPGGNPQPITTAPQIEIDLNNGIDRYVFFGTGRLLDPSDLTTPAVPQQQTFYAIRDGSLAKIDPIKLPNGIQPRIGPGKMDPINADEVSAIAGGAPNGWFQDLPNNPADVYDPVTNPSGRGAERIVVDPQANVNIAVYVGTMIQSDPCVISLPAFLFARDYTTGKSLIQNSGGTVQPYIAFASGIVGLAAPLGILNPASGGGSPTCCSLGGLISGEVPGTSAVSFVNPITGPGLRWSWRLLTGE